MFYLDLFLIFLLVFLLILIDRPPCRVHKLQKPGMNENNIDGEFVDIVSNPESTVMGQLT